MELFKPANAVPLIKIEQSVKHHEWVIQKKEGVTVIEKKNEKGAGPSTNRNEMTAYSAVGTNLNQLGARPKVKAEVPKKLDFLNINVTSGPKNEVKVQVPKQNVITLTPVTSAKNQITINATGPPKASTTATRATSAPSKHGMQTRSGVIINAASAPKKDVITISTVAAPKKEVVIKINAVQPPKKEVVAVRTATGLKSGTPSEGGAAANGNFVQLVQQAQHNHWNINNENRKAEQAETSLKKESGRTAEDGSSVVYTEEACQIQEMFPSIPLSVIANDLKATGSMETTIENLLDGKVIVPPKPSSHRTTPPLVPGAHKTVAPQSAEAERKLPETTKRSGSVIKIEFQANHEVWNIKKKNQDQEVYVMKKSVSESEDQSQSSEAASVSSLHLNSTLEAMDEDSVDSFYGDEIYVDDEPYKTDPNLMNAPVKLMEYSQSSIKHSSVSKRKSSTVQASEPMEVDNFENDYSPQEESKPIESFEFSDDENEEGVTIEQFLFRASLKLKMCKYHNEKGIQKSNNSELLKITGSKKGPNDDSAEGCMKNEKECDLRMTEKATKCERGDDIDMIEKAKKCEKQRDDDMTEKATKCNKGSDIDVGLKATKCEKKSRVILSGVCGSEEDLEESESSDAEGWCSEEEYYTD